MKRADPADATKRSELTIPRPRGRGPVEARSTAGQPISGEFRARAGAAPLKHTLRPESRRLCTIPRPRGRGPVEAVRMLAVASTLALATFRARAGAAPLKCIADAVSARISRISFRARAGAAPLKLTPGIETVALIPRPRGRGPVEALRAVYSTLGIIPRPRGRGPVEATKACIAPVNEPISVPFRARAGAAPLKQRLASLVRRAAEIWSNSAPARARPR